MGLWRRSVVKPIHPDLVGLIEQERSRLSVKFKTNVTFSEASKVFATKATSKPKKKDNGDIKLW